jgi:putative transposase
MNLFHILGDMFHISRDMFCIYHKPVLYLGRYILYLPKYVLYLPTQGYELSDVLRDFKKFTASSILKSIQKDPESRREWLMYLFKYLQNMKVRVENISFGNRTIIRLS